LRILSLGIQRRRSLLGRISNCGLLARTNVRRTGCVKLDAAGELGATRLCAICECPRQPQVARSSSPNSE
jgi:hypothetical protein